MSFQTPEIFIKMRFKFKSYHLSVYLSNIIKILIEYT